MPQNSNAQEGPKLATLRVGGDSPFRCRVLGISVSPQVASLFNDGVWDIKAKQWHNLDTRRSAEGDAAHLAKYMKGTPSIQVACTAEPLLCVPYSCFLSGTQC